MSFRKYGSNKSSSASVLAALLNRLRPHTAADDDLLELKLAQTHVALTGPKRQQILQLMMIC